MNYIKMSPLTGMVGYGGGASGLTFKSGKSMPLWLGERGFEIGGNRSGLSDVIGYHNIKTTGNSSDFGDLLEVKYQLTAGGGDGRAVQPGGRNTNGNTHTDRIEYWAIGTLGNAADFGNMADSEGWSGHQAAGNGVRLLMSGGNGSTNADNGLDTIQYITIANTGDTSDFGDMAHAIRGNHGSMSSETKCFFVGGKPWGAGGVDTRCYVTIDTTGDSTDYGDLDTERWGMGSGGDETRAILWGGNSNPGGSLNNDIKYFAMDSQGSTSDFGDITGCSTYSGPSGGVSGDNTKNLSFGAEVSGGSLTALQINYITVQTTGNSSDFGDLLVSHTGSAMCAGTA